MLLAFAALLLLYKMRIEDLEERVDKLETSVMDFDDFMADICDTLTELWHERHGDNPPIMGKNDDTSNLPF